MSAQHSCNKISHAGHFLFNKLIKSFHGLSMTIDNTSYNVQKNSFNEWNHLLLLQSFEQVITSFL